MTRRLARELALKALFQLDLVGADPLEALRHLAEEDVPAEAVAFARELVEGTVAHLREVDAGIQRYARDWRLERLAPVDRNILRLSLFQILHRPDIPVSVAINEAVELAKTYGTPESGRFVNGILGQFARDRERPPDGEAAPAPAEGEAAPGAARAGDAPEGRPDDRGALD